MFVLSTNDARNDQRFPNTFLPPEKLGIEQKPIYFYNVSQRVFSRNLPPNHPKLRFEACPKGQRYALVGELTHPYLQPEFDTQNNRTARYVSGYREAVAMLNPSNPSNGENPIKDQDFEQAFSANENGNWNKYGVFWSTHNPPLKEEVNAAYARMEKAYRGELERMNKARSAEEAINMANTLSHAAADYFGKSFLWHQSDLEVKAAPVEDDRMDCGECGESIKSTAKVCRFCSAPTDPKELASYQELRRARNTFKPAQQSK
jgi:hypothetical protein